MLKKQLQTYYSNQFENWLKFHFNNKSTLKLGLRPGNHFYLLWDFVPSGLKSYDWISQSEKGKETLFLKRRLERVLLFKMGANPVEVINSFLLCSVWDFSSAKFDSFFKQKLVSKCLIFLDWSILIKFLKGCFTWEGPIEEGIGVVWRAVLAAVMHKNAFSWETERSGFLYWVLF